MAGMKALALVVLLSACTTYNGSKRAAKVGGYVMLTGASVAAVGGGIIVVKGDGESGPVWTAIFLAVIGAAIFTPGAALGTGGLIGMATHDGAVASALAHLSAYLQANCTGCLCNMER